MSVLEWAAYRGADACIGLSPGIAAGIARRAPAGRRIAQIPNGSDLETFHPRLRAPLGLPGVGPDDFVAGFTGAHGPANGLDALLDVARELRRRGDRRVKIAFIGDGKEKDRLRAAAVRDGLDNCLFFDPIQKHRLGAVTASLGCGLMVLKDVPAFYDGTSPNKFFDYAAAGLPIINNYPGWLAGLIQETGAGVVVPPRDPAAFADALQALAADPELRRRQGAAARALAESRFARADLAARFVSELETVSRLRS
jgi:glycosyltransferase involved in cell wall biosynthesis